ncbi:MAG: hypothetical protein JHC20_02385 [Pyrobaculum sp.]|nr:hypothetical protein [Pyrobaculum sp.]
MGFETPSGSATSLKPPVAKSLNAFFYLLVSRTLLSETSWRVKWDERHCPSLILSLLARALVQRNLKTKAPSSNYG